MADGGIIQEQRAILAESFRDLRDAWSDPQVPTYAEVGLAAAEVVGLAAIDIGVTLLRSTAEVAEEGAWRGIEAFRSALGLYAFKRCERNPQWEDSLGFLVTAVTFNATEEYLDKKGRNGDV